MPNVSARSTHILRKPAVIERVSLSGSTIWRLVRKKKFPAPIELSENAVGWLESDIDGWIAARRERTAGPVVVRRSPTKAKRRRR